MGYKLCLKFSSAVYPSVWNIDQARLAATVVSAWPNSCMIQTSRKTLKLKGWRDVQQNMPHEFCPSTEFEQVCIGRHGSANALFQLSFSVPDEGKLTVSPEKAGRPDSPLAWLKTQALTEWPCY